MRNRIKALRKVAFLATLAALCTIAAGDEIMHSNGVQLPVYSDKGTLKYCDGAPVLPGDGAVISNSAACPGESVVHIPNKILPNHPLPGKIEPDQTKNVDPANTPAIDAAPGRQPDVVTTHRVTEGGRQRLTDQKGKEQHHGAQKLQAAKFRAAAKNGKISKAAAAAASK